MIDLLKKRIAAAPNLLVIVCLLPILIFTVGLILNFSWLALIFLFISIFVAYQAMSPKPISKQILLIWLAVNTMFYIMVTYHAHFAFFNFPDLTEISAIGWFSDAVKLLIWPFIISLFYSLISLVSILYLLNSKQIKDFYSQH